MPKIALIQQPASPDKATNLERGIEAARNAIEQGAQLIAFAELGFEPFYPQRHATPEALECAEEIPGPTTERFQELAAAAGVVFILNLFERDGDHTFDTSPVIDADGSLLGKTRMIHITDSPGFHEQGFYAPGDSGAPVYDTRVGKVGVAICYDRHYPEYMRALAVAGAELVVIPQAGAVDEWPDGLFEAEVRVAAFHNGYFAALCNRVGAEEVVTFAGESFVASPNGQVIAQAGQGEETLLVDVDFQRNAESCARRHFFPDRRPELYADWLRG